MVRQILLHKIHEIFFPSLCCKQIHKPTDREYEQDYRNKRLNTLFNHRIRHLKLPWKFLGFQIFIGTRIAYLKFRGKIFGLNPLHESLPRIEESRKSGILFRIILSRRKVCKHRVPCLITRTIDEAEPIWHIFPHRLRKCISTDIVDWNIIHNLLSCNGSFFINNKLSSYLLENLAFFIFDDDFSLRSNMDISTVRKGNAEIDTKISRSRQNLRHIRRCRKKRKKTFFINKRRRKIANRTFIHRAT